MTPEDVEALFHKQLSSEGEALAQERTELLRGVSETLKETGSSEGQDLELYVEKLANGSRDATWREPLGESGVLGFALWAIREERSSKALKIHSLRLIGNSCAYTNANRERVVESNAITTIMGLLSEYDILLYAVAVLLNFMLDYAPAQLQASNSKLSARLVDLISSPDVDAFQSQLGTICKLLNLLVSQEPEPTNANPDTPLTLLKLTQDPTIAEDTEDLLSLVSVSMEYLSHEALQNPFITANGVPTFLSIFETLHGQAYDPENLEEPELSNQITVLRKVLSNALADVTGKDAFADAHPIGSPVFVHLRGWLDSPNTSLRAAACLSIGNLSCSDEAALALVNELVIHAPLVTALSSTEDTLLLHSALSFLKNLSIPLQNRATLGPLLLKPEVLPRIWALETLPQVQLTSASVTRLLAVGNPANVDTLIALDETGRSYLHGVISLFERTDDPTKMEAARVVLAVLRTLASTDSETDLESFYEKHGGVKDAVSYLLTQQRFPPLRSEAFFVLGLLASRSPSSIPMILSLLSSSEIREISKRAILGSLLEAQEENPLAVSEPKEPKEDAVRADRENVLVVVSRLLGSLSLADRGEQRGELERLLTEGGVAV